LAETRTKIWWLARFCKPHGLHYYRVYVLQRVMLSAAEP